MPMHDWTKVYSGLFHDFHQGWSITIRNALNGGLLPKGMSAFIEHKVGVVGDLLPDMPLFLSESYHVAVPLEAAYRTNWSTMTEDVQRIVETGVMPGGDGDD